MTEPGGKSPSGAVDQEAYLLLPAMAHAREYLSREDAPDANKVNVAFRILDEALDRWERANPLPDDEDQMDEVSVHKACCLTPLYEMGHAITCPVATQPKVHGGLNQPWSGTPEAHHARYMEQAKKAGWIDDEAPPQNAHSGPTERGSA